MIVDPLDTILARILNMIGRKVSGKDIHNLYIYGSYVSLVLHSASDNAHLVYLAFGGNKVNRHEICVGSLIGDSFVGQDMWSLNVRTYFNSLKHKYSGE